MNSAAHGGQGLDVPRSSLDVHPIGATLRSGAVDRGYSGIFGDDGNDSMQVVVFDLAVDAHHRRRGVEEILGDVWAASVMMRE